MIIMWAFSFVLVDIAVDIIPPMAVAFYRFVIASASLFIIRIYTKIKAKRNPEATRLVETNENPKFSKNDWILIVISSFAAISVFFYAQYNAINLIGPSLPALFVCLLSPVIISVLALIIFDEKLNKLKVLGFVIATVGAFLLVTGGNISNLAPSSPNFLGYFLALLTPVLWAAYTILSKKITKVKSNLKAIEYISYFGTIELLIIVLITDQFQIFLENFFNITLFLIALYLGPGCYILGYAIWQSSQQKLKSSKASSFLYIEPFFTLLFSFLLQRSEAIVLWNILGGIIVLFAVILINYK